MVPFPRVTVFFFCSRYGLVFVCCGCFRFFCCYRFIFGFGVWSECADKRNFSSQSSIVQEGLLPLQATQSGSNLRSVVKAKDLEGDTQAQEKMDKRVRSRWCLRL